jgi:Mg/Co/Ni transporter MgtE
MKPFDFISSQPIEEIKKHLEKERPAVVNQVLKHLPDNVRSKIYPGFNLTDFPSASPEVLREIERVLERRII